MTRLPLAIALPYARQCDAEDLIMEQLAALDIQEAEATAPRRIEQEARLALLQQPVPVPDQALAWPYIPPHRR